MGRRLISKANGFVHDIASVASLSDEPTNIRLLSDRSLYILQNLSLEDVTFLSRYGEILTNGFYLPVLSGSPEEADVVDAVNLIRRDLNSMAIEELLECICVATSALAELATLDGQKVEQEPSDGDVTFGPGEQYQTEESYLAAKCSAANAIYDTVLETTRWLETNNIDLLGGVLGGMTTALGLGLLISGPVGWAVTLAAVTVTALTTYLISQAIDFGDLEAALVDVHEELVLSLFNASNTITAKSNFIAAIAASSEPTTGVERDLVGLMLSSDLLNLLFSIRQDVGDYESPDPVDCTPAWSHTFDFTASDGGWTNDATHSRPFGVYSAGVGWVSVWGDVGGDFDERLYLEKTGVSGEVIQMVTVVYEFVGSCGSLRQTGVKLWDGAVLQKTDVKTPTCGSFTHLAVLSDDGTIITTSAVGDANADGELEITITEIVVTGSGVDPF